MDKSSKSLETLNRAVELSTNWQLGVDLSKINRDSIAAHKKLDRIGLVFATFSRTRRVEDFHTLPRNQANTTLFELVDGTTRELPARTSLLLLEAPIFIEVLTEKSVTAQVLIEYCLAQEDDNPFIARRKVFTPAPLISFVPKNQ